jgi:hypothetical protein
MISARIAAVLTWAHVAAFWLGFALPIPWLFGIARAVLLAFAWKSLN